MTVIHPVDVWSLGACYCNDIYVVFVKIGHVCAAQNSLKLDKMQRNYSKNIKDALCKFKNWKESVFEILGFSADNNPIKALMFIVELTKVHFDIQTPVSWYSASLNQGIKLSEFNIKGNTKT